MDNPARTAEYRARMDERRRALRALFQSILPNEARFTWELGCGHGHFLTAYAQAQPERICIGIDIVGERIERALRKRDRAKLANLHFIHAEARLFLDEVPVTARIEDVFVLFPDPWPKLRHHKNRIIQADFLSAVATRVAATARLCFRTDFKPYFNDAESVIREHSAWALATDAAAHWPFEHETVFQSRAASFHSLIARRRAPEP